MYRRGFFFLWCLLAAFSLLFQLWFAPIWCVLVPLRTIQPRRHQSPGCRVSSHLAYYITLLVSAAAAAAAAAAAVGYLLGFGFLFCFCFQKQPSAWTLWSSWSLGPPSASTPDISRDRESRLATSLPRSLTPTSCFVQSKSGLPCHDVHFVSSCRQKTRVQAWRILSD